MNFTFSMPRINLLFGRGIRRQLGEQTAQLGKKVLLVTGRGAMARLGYVDELSNVLRKAGLSVVHYGGVRPNPTVEMVDGGAEVAMSEGCDVIVGLGGGSAMDTGKAIAAVVGHSTAELCSIWDFVKMPNRSSRDIGSQALPIVAVTTTSGSGSHVTRYSTIINASTHEKKGFMSPYLFPTVSIVDPEILANMTPKITAETGFDAMTHAFEALLSRSSDPIVEMYALQALSLAAVNLPLAFENPGNLQARENMALADTLGAWAVSVTKPVLPHAMSHPISANYPDISHGAALAILTPAIMRYNIENGDAAVWSKYARIAGALGANTGSTDDRDEAFQAVAAVENLIDRLDLPHTLGEVGVQRERVTVMEEETRRTMESPVKENPVEVARGDIEKLFLGLL